MNTVERLSAYNSSFPLSTMEHVAQVAEKQSQFDSYGKYFESVGISEDHIGAHVVDLVPKDCDTSEAIVYHLPMANPLDPNQLFTVATLASTFPNRRLVAFSNPSGSNYNFIRINTSKLPKISCGDFSPAVEGQASYFEMNGVEKVNQIGGSYGVELALALGSGDYLLSKSTLLIEPVSVIKRGLKKLGDDFKSSEEALQVYASAVDMKTYEDARDESINKNAYRVALLRPTNIAIIKGIAKGRFSENLTKMLEKQDSPVNVVWGSESELVDTTAVRLAIRNANSQFGFDSVRGVELEGQKHAMCNDIHLLATLAHLAIAR